MFIIQAILLARSEYVVYFLLSAWLESLERKRYARSIPREARQLPVHGIEDLGRRLNAVRERLEHTECDRSNEVRGLRDAAAALSVACEKLRELTSVKSAMRPRRLDRPLDCRRELAGSRQR